MRNEAEQVLARFALSNLARRGADPQYQWVVETARREGLAGATVLQGVFGLSADGALLRERPWALAREHPVVIEVVDAPEAISRLLARVEPEFGPGTLTLERAHVLLYRAGRESQTLQVPERVAGNGVQGEVVTMKLPEQGVLLRAFIGESDREPGSGRPLYEALVLRAREAGLAGATVLKGPMGFGRHSRVHAARLLELSTDLPVLIEIVDTEEKVQAFLPVVDELVVEGLVTLEAVRVLKYASPDHRA